MHRTSSAPPGKYFGYRPSAAAMPGLSNFNKKTQKIFSEKLVYSFDLPIP